MTNKIILKGAARFVQYILLFAMVLLITTLSYINASYGRKTVGNEAQSFLENRPGSNVPGGSVDFGFLKWILSFLGNRTNDTIPFNIGKKDQKNVNRYLISGTFLVSDKGISFSLSDSLLLNYRKWDVSPNNRISYTPQGILVTDFVLSNDSANISIVSQQNLAGSPIDISIQNFDIRDIPGIFSKDSLMASGLLDAKILLTEFGKSLPAFTCTGSVRDFKLMQQPIGNLQINAQKVNENTIHASLGLAENGNELNVSGNIFLNNGLQQLDAALEIKKLQMSTLQGFMKGNMSSASGSINGIIALKGKFTQPGWKGMLNFDTAKFTLARLGSSYIIDKQSISLDYPDIIFNRITIKDSLDHQLTINGKICSKKNTPYDLDIDLNSQDFTLINAPKAINNQFYGYAGINVNVSITGNTKNPLIEGDIFLNKKTGVTLVLPEKNIDSDAARAAVRFINRDEFALPELGAFTPATEPRVDFEQYLNRKLNIRADRLATLTFVIDPTNGDELIVQGDARLNAGIDPDGNMVMAGTYLIDSGYYELNYQFLKKRFNVRRGSTLYFGGGPGEAQINIKAEYIANTSPKDLLGNEVGSVDPKIARSFNQKIPFKVVLLLKGLLKKPAISFDIQMPEEGAISSQLRTTIENKLVQLRADIAATNKQVFALLGLDRFVGEQSTDFFMGNGSGFSDIARESVSKFLSDALDQIASDLFTGINVDLNLNSFKDFTNNDETEKTDLNVEVSKSFLNDRLSVTVGKNFGIEGQDGSAKAAKQKGSRFLPDVTVNYKLSADGKYKIRSYAKNQFEVILDGYVVETGLAFIVTMDYDKFNELFINKNKKAGQ